MNPEQIQQLQLLYRELHLTCERAAAALRMAARPGAPSSELLAKFRAEEDRAKAIWEEIRSNGHLDP